MVWLRAVSVIRVSEKPLRTTPGVRRMAVTTPRVAGSLPVIASALLAQPANGLGRRFLCRPVDDAFPFASESNRSESRMVESMRLIKSDAPIVVQLFREMTTAWGLNVNYGLSRFHSIINCSPGANAILRKSYSAVSHTSCAVSTTRCGLARCASIAMSVPCTGLEKPHCSERANRSIGAHCSPREWAASRIP